MLRYVDGSPCPENPKRLISSNFTFPCYNNGKVINRYLFTKFCDFKKYYSYVFMIDFSRDFRNLKDMKSALTFLSGKQV